MHLYSRQSFKYKNNKKNKKIFTNINGVIKWLKTIKIIKTKNKNNKNKNKSFLIIYGALAILFQPFFKIALGRELWNIVDVIVGVGLIISLFIEKQQKKD